VITPADRRRRINPGKKKKKKQPPRFWVWMSRSPVVGESLFSLLIANQGWLGACAIRARSPATWMVGHLRLDDRARYARRRSVLLLPASNFGYAAFFLLSRRAVSHPGRLRSVGPRAVESSEDAVSQRSKASSKPTWRARSFHFSMIWKIHPQLNAGAIDIRTSDLHELCRSAEVSWRIRTRTQAHSSPE